MIYDCCVRLQKCRSIFKHVLKRCDNRKVMSQACRELVACDKIVSCKSAHRGVDVRACVRSVDDVMAIKPIFSQRWVTIFS